MFWLDALAFLRHDRLVRNSEPLSTRLPIRHGPEGLDLAQSGALHSHAFSTVSQHDGRSVPMSRLKRSWEGGGSSGCGWPPSRVQFPVSSGLVHNRGLLALDGVLVLVRMFCNSRQCNGALPTCLLMLLQSGVEPPDSLPDVDLCHSCMESCTQRGIVCPEAAHLSPW